LPLDGKTFRTRLHTQFYFWLINDLAIELINCVNQIRQLCTRWLGTFVLRNIVNGLLLNPSKTEAVAVAPEAVWQVGRPWYSEPHPD